MSVAREHYDRAKRWITIHRLQRSVGKHSTDCREYRALNLSVNLFF